jgi:hypothetical protein
MFFFSSLSIFVRYTFEQLRLLLQFFRHFSSLSCCVVFIAIIIGCFFDEGIDLSYVSFFRNYYLCLWLDFRSVNTGFLLFFFFGRNSIAVFIVRRKKCHRWTTCFFFLWVWQVLWRLWGCLRLFEEGIDEEGEIFENKRYEPILQTQRYHRWYFIIILIDNFTFSV